MIKLTEQAAKQIIDSAEQGKMQGIPLRLAIKKQDDGSFHYAMGFDEQRLPGDIFVNIEASLNNHDAYTILTQLDDIVLTGNTGTNVNDLKLLIIGSEN